MLTAICEHPQNRIFQTFKSNFYFTIEIDIVDDNINLWNRSSLPDTSDKLDSYT